MNPRPPIPTPPAVRWREFRERVLPYLAFVVVAGLAVVFWNQRRARSSFVAHAESIRVQVTPSRAGVVAALEVDLLQPVKKGEVVAQLIPLELATAAADLTAGIEQLRASLGQDADRNLVNYQGLRIDWLRRNVELASGRVELQLAEGEFQRYAALHRNRSVTDAEFELRRANRDALKDKVAGLERLSTELEQEIARLKPLFGAENPVDRAISAAATAQEKQLQSLAEAATLRAPMDGVVSAVLKRPGENVLPGEIILTIGAAKATRIIGYVRQPLNERPRVGDAMQVHALTGTQRIMEGRVLRVGTQLEPIDPTLLPALAKDARVIEYGLPLVITLPEGLELAAGEAVALTPAGAR